MRRVLVEVRGLLLATGAILLLAVGIQSFTALPVLRFVLDSTPYLALLLGVALAAPLLPLALRLQVRDAQGHRITDWRLGWRLTWQLLRREYFTMEGVTRALLVTLLLGCCLAVYGGWKVVIPDVQPFAWDARLARIDRWLHGGRAPWEWLQPLMRPFLTRVLDRFYLASNAGFALGVGCLAWSRHPQRQRVLLSIVFLWFGLGAVLATALSSAGPAFMDPHFSVERAYLSGIPGLVSVRAQRLMWMLHVAGGGHPFGGISAMPSVHVAMPALFTLAAAERVRWLLWPGLVAVLITLIATVHLGWHYAVDGYVALVAVPVVWRVTYRGS